MKKPEIGDHIKIEGKITRISEDGVYFYLGDKTNQSADYLLVIRADSKFITEVTSPPREPQVGDDVYWVARKHHYPKSLLVQPYRLLYIHEVPGDGRKWGVVAYKGDAPCWRYFEDLRLDPPCAD